METILRGHRSSKSYAKTTDQKPLANEAPESDGLLEFLMDVCPPDMRRAHCCEP
jgi:hypothetical protein